MARYRCCAKCEQPDLTVSYRGHNLGVLCAACNVDAHTSSVRQVPVPERQQHDRYAQMAAKYGVK